MSFDVDAFEMPRGHSPCLNQDPDEIRLTSHLTSHTQRFALTYAL